MGVGYWVLGIRCLVFGDSEMASYRDLRVWQEGKQLAVAVYEGTQSEKWNRDWGLRDQVRRSAVSVPSNIAEGEARKSQKDSIRFFQISLGSLAELATQVEIAFEIGYFNNEASKSLLERVERLQASMGALIKARKDLL